MSTSISEHVGSCLESFNSIATISVIESEGQDDSKKPEWKIGHELSRFKVWSGNIGAHQQGKRSLDYRLRDASHLSTQVKTLLKDLKDALDNALSILNGTKIPWDQEVFSDESDDESISGPDDNDIGFSTEMDQISVDVAEVISCLMNLSVSIRNPAPHDRLRGSIKTDTSFYEPTDIAHVQAKFGSMDPGLVELLGKANSRRRQYFKYRESHHKKLAQGLDINFDTGNTISERQSTIASSIPDKLKTSAWSLADAVDADELSDSGFTQTSYASSANTSDRPRFPALPLDAAKGPFQCPFCFMMITVTTYYAWRKHVFADLRPYICVAVDCPIAGTEFGRRHQWMQHMLQNHWREWHCVYCVHEPFDSASSLRNHLQCLHAETVLQHGIETAINICEHPSSFNAETKCPLCNCSLGSVKTYRHHVGRHLEDIALFVLPHIPGEDGVSDDDNSIRSDSDPDYVDGEYEEQNETEDTLTNKEARNQIGGTGGQRRFQSKDSEKNEEDQEEAGSSQPVPVLTQSSQPITGSPLAFEKAWEARLYSTMPPSPNEEEGSDSDVRLTMAPDTENAISQERIQSYPAAFQCTLCPKRFTRAYNLRSHLRSHTDEEPFICMVCEKAFERREDRMRHEASHFEEDKKWVCKGDLKAGGQWGCGIRYAVADELEEHFRSEAGQICIKPLLDEELLERQRALIGQPIQQDMHDAATQQNIAMDANAYQPMDPGIVSALPASPLAQSPTLAQGNGQSAERIHAEDDGIGSEYDAGEDTGHVSGLPTIFGEGTQTSSRDMWMPYFHEGS